MNGKSYSSIENRRYYDRGRDYGQHHYRYVPISDEQHDYNGEHSIVDDQYSDHRRQRYLDKSNSPDIVPPDELFTGTSTIIRRYKENENDDSYYRKPHRRVDFNINANHSGIDQEDNIYYANDKYRQWNEYDGMLNKRPVHGYNAVDSLNDEIEEPEHDKEENENGFSRLSKSKTGDYQKSYYPGKQETLVVNSGARDGSAGPTSTLIKTGHSSVSSPNGKYRTGCCWWTAAAGRIDRENDRISTFGRSITLISLLAVLLIALMFAIGSLFYFNNVTYKPRESIVQDPCESKFCTYGATCVVDMLGKAVCKCPADCPAADTPVCGTDGVSYKNLCSLRSTACHNQLNIRVQYPGECNLQDPCRGHVCQYGAKCVPLADGRTAACECPSQCPNYGDHVGSRPVCASDGSDYNNLCELNRSSCITGTNLTIKYEGYCDPCSHKECSSTEMCLLDPDRNAVCACSELCPSEYSPVCGSDGKTYSNECALKRQSCHSKRTLRIVYRGKCSSGANPCTNVNCKQNEECIINKFGIAACECMSDCEPIVRPVCGTDAATYDSLCHLQQASCRLNNNVTFAYRGICGSNMLCANHSCQFYSQCVPNVHNNQTTCQCPICNGEFEPVCGSDGITYENQCKLELESCRLKKEIRTLYAGLCDGCQNKKCQFNSVCESDVISAEAKCVCPSNCTEEKSPVCGSDGVTYGNECELKRSSCLAEKPITVSYVGSCDTCQEIKCKYGARCESGVCVCPSDCAKDLSVSVIDEPVCASDMKTYANECEMQKHACLNSLESLTVLFYGDCKERIDTPLLITEVPNVEESNFNSSMEHREICQDIHCEFDGTCEAAPDGFPRCSCIFECPANSTKAVCGSDLQLYPSLCHMKMKACQKQEEIRLRPLDLCQGMEIKPCNGKKPIIDEETDSEINCGNGPGRKDCPSGSYCHQTPQFAKCCTKDSGVYIARCQDSWYGCCPDNKTAAQGPDNAGCPSLCGCNKLGSAQEYCDPSTGQCKCKPGVGGEKCDRCEPGFWGLPKISSGHPGCLPCGCSLFGSVRDDCEQMTGRCVCKPGIEGAKCTVCSDPAKILGPNGCVSTDVVTPKPISCDALSCYFGAVCEVKDGEAKCVCHISCSQEYDGQTQAVCGNDGQTYSSECQLKLYSCRYQKDIAVQALSSCTDDYVSETEAPPKLGAWTSVTRYAEVEDSANRISKSTRHVLMSEVRSEEYTVKSGTVDAASSPSINKPSSPNVINKLNLFETNAAAAVIANNQKEVYKIINDPSSSMSHRFIGDICNSNEDCKIEGSKCSSRICVCKDNLTASSDRRTCSVELALPVVQNRCSSSPCENNGVCIDKAFGRFVCQCVQPYFGDVCQNSSLNNTNISVAAFGGQSYIVLKQLKAYHKFSIEIEFKSYTSNGILLYSQQHADGTGDFISLALINGLIEFRYNLGNGQAILRSVQHLSVNSYHKVVAKRYQRDGILQVDNNESVAGQSEGTLRALDLNENAYVGYIPAVSNKVFENIGTNVGLVGCIRRLKIGRHVVDLNEREETIVEKLVEVNECANVTKCDESNKNESCACTGNMCEIEANPCLSQPCQFGSTCEVLLQGSYVCKCLPGYRGNYCEIFEPEPDDFYIPQFNGVDSYIKLPCLDGAKRDFSIEIWFIPSNNKDGMLLYNGQTVGRKGDFISINIINDRAQFRYDLGSGIANITTENKIKKNDWNVVRVNRFDRTGTIQLNNGETVKGISGPILNELNLELPLFIAGMPSLNEASYDSGIIGRFSGAIQRVLINGKPARLKTIGEDYNVTPFLQHVCFAKNSDHVCLNGGQCIPYFMSYVCKCSLKFTGLRCENYTGTDNLDSEAGIHFNGNMYLYYTPSTKHQQSPELHLRFVNISLPAGEVVDDALVVDNYSDNNNSDDNNENYYGYEYLDDMYDESVDYDFFYNRPKPKKSINYEFSLKTVQMNSVLIWCSRLRQSQRDYIAVSINNGSIEFAHGFGKEQEVIYLKSREIVSDGNWHTISIQHKRRLTQLRVDDNKPLRLQTNYQHKLFTINSRIFIGNIPNIRLDYPASYRNGYQGCLRNLQIDKKKLSLLQLHSNSPIPLQLCQENDV